MKLLGPLVKAYDQDIRTLTVANGIRTNSDITLSDGDVKVGLYPKDGNTSGALKVTNASGYITIGPLNTTYTHYMTDRNAHYFNKPLRVAGEIYAGTNYDQKVYHPGNKPTLADLGYTGATDANNYVHPTDPGSLHIPADGADGQFLKWLSDGSAQWSGLVSGDVGLGNVTNESKATMFTNPVFTGAATVKVATGVGTKTALKLLGDNQDVDLYIGGGTGYSENVGFWWRYKGTLGGNSNSLQLWTNNFNDQSVDGPDLQVYDVKQDGIMDFKINPTVNGNTIYHAGNIPTPANVGAVAKTGDTMSGLLTLQGQADTGATGNTADVALAIEHATAGGSSSIFFKSAQGHPSDYGYIRYKDTVGAAGTEQGQLIIGTENDGASATADTVKINTSKTIINSPSAAAGDNIVEFQYQSANKGRITNAGHMILTGDVAQGGFGAVRGVVPIFGFDEGSADVTEDTWTRFSRITYTAEGSLFVAPVQNGATREYYIVLRYADNIGAEAGSTDWRFWFSWAEKAGHKFTIPRCWGGLDAGNLIWFKVPAISAQGTAAGASPLYWELQAKLPAEAKALNRTLRIVNIWMVAVDKVGGTQPTITLDTDTYITFAKPVYHLGGSDGKLSIGYNSTELELKLGTNKVFHQGFLPTPVQIGAIPTTAAGVSLATLDEHGKVTYSQLPDTTKQQVYIRSRLVDRDAIPTVNLLPGDRCFLTGKYKGPNDEDLVDLTQAGDSYIWDGATWILMADKNWENTSIQWSLIEGRPPEMENAMLWAHPNTMADHAWFTKEAIEGKLTGNITTHTHDQYMTTAGGTVTGPLALQSTLGVTGATTLNGALTTKGPVRQYLNNVMSHYPNVVSHYETNNMTGAFVIHTPIARNSSAMFAIRIHGYAFGNARRIDSTITGYAYASTEGSPDGQSGVIINYSLTDNGNDGFPKWVGIDANGKIAVAIGAHDSSTYFWRFSVDAWVTHVATDMSTGWSVDVNTTSGFGWIQRIALSNLIATGVFTGMITTPGLRSTSSLNVDLPSNGKGLKIYGNAKDLDIYMGHTTDNGTTFSGGFYWRYVGSGTGINKSLQLWTENNSATNTDGPDVQVYNVTQDGVMDFKVAPTINSSAIWTAGAFDPNDYLPLTGGTMTGDLNLESKDVIIDGANAGGWSRGLIFRSNDHVTNYIKFAGYGDGATFGYAFVGSAYDQTAARFYTDNTVSFGHLRSDLSLDATDVIFYSTDKTTKRMTLKSPDSNSVWAISNALSSELVLAATSYSNDKTVSFKYLPGTTGAGAGLLEIGQQRKNDTNFTHGVTAFLTNGLERMRIDKDGRVLVGATTGYAGTMVVNKANSAGVGGDLWITNSGAGAIGSAARLTFEASGTTDTTPGVTISHIMESAGSPYDSRLTFALYSNGPGMVDRLTIKSSGKVGIGTTSPNQILHVNGSMEVNGTVFYDDVSRYWLAVGTNTGLYWNTTDNKVEFHDAGVVKASIDVDSGVMWQSTPTFSGDSAFSFITSAGGAQRLQMGSLLVSNTYADSSKVPTNGAYVKGDMTSDGKGTFVSLVLPSKTTDGTLKIGNVMIGSNNGSDLIFKGVTELRFGTSTTWAYNDWAGLKYDTTNKHLYIGGPASSQFAGNTNPSLINVTFDGIDTVNVNGKLKATGDVIFDGGNTTVSSNGGVNFFSIVRDIGDGLSNQLTRFSVTDAETIVETQNDENGATLRFKLSASDMESGAGTLANSFQVKFETLKTVANGHQYGIYLSGDGGNTWNELYHQGALPGLGDLHTSTGLSVMGNPGTANATPADIIAGTDGHVLRRSGDSLGFGTITTTAIDANAITNAKLAKVAKWSIIGTPNDLAETATPEYITAATVGHALRLGADNKLGFGTISTDGIADAAITSAKLRNSLGLSVIGNAGSDPATPGDIVADTDAYVLRRNGSTLGFGQVATAGIEANAVTNSKLRKSGPLSVIGNATNADADPADISVGTDAASDGYVLRRNGTVLGFGTVGTLGITDDAITNTKLRNSAGLSVIGRNSNTTGDPADIAAGTDGHVLRRSGTTLGFGTIATAGITDKAVTLAKIQDINTNIILGRKTALSGVVEQLTPADVLTMLGVESGANKYTHPTYDGDDISLTTIGAQVISNLTITTDTTGHVTDASVSTRDLTPADIKAVGLKQNVTGSSTTDTVEYRNVAAYTHNAGTISGAMKITLPFSWTSTMMQIEIVGYDYSTKSAWRLLIGGYNYNTTSIWRNATALLIGDAPFDRVRLAHDGTKCCIILGTETTSWLYPKVHVAKFVAGYANTSGWDTGWSMGLVTDLTGITTSYDKTVWGFDSIYRDGRKPTAVDVGAVPLASGLAKITGTGAGNANQAYVAFYESDGSTRKGYLGDSSTNSANMWFGADAGDVILGVPEGNSLRAYVGTTYYKIYHEGNKPALADLGYTPYQHPSYTERNLNETTEGVQVISAVTFTSDTLGHVTGISVSKRQLTIEDINNPGDPGTVITGGEERKLYQFTPTTVDWYRVMFSDIGYMGGTVRFSTYYDNAYTDIEIQFSIAGNSLGGSIQQTRFSSYNNGVIDQIRISSSGGNSVYLDIHVAKATAPGIISVYGYGPRLGTFTENLTAGATVGSTDVKILTLGHGLRTTSGIVGGSATFSGNITGVGDFVEANNLYSIHGRSSDGILHLLAGTTTGRIYLGYGQSGGVQFGDGTTANNVLVKNGNMVIEGTGGGLLSLRSISTGADHVYMQFYADAHNVNTRSGYIGYGSGGTTTMSIVNETGGNISLSTGGDISLVAGAGKVIAANRKITTPEVAISNTIATPFSISRTGTTPTNVNMSFAINTTTTYVGIDDEGSLKVGSDADLKTNGNKIYHDGYHPKPIIEYYTVPGGGVTKYTSITIPNSKSYAVGAKQLHVSRDGITQRLDSSDTAKDNDYWEVSSTTIRFNYSLPAGSVVEFHIIPL